MTTGMHRLVDAVRQAMAQQNWYAGLSLAMTLPDICGKMREPQNSSSRRYIAWVDEYLTPGWTHTLTTFGGDERQLRFLNGADMYALRCALLHEGSDDILGQRVREVLAGFEFRAYPQPGMIVHLNLLGPRLQLQVDVFCEEVCVGVEQWLAEVHGVDADITARIDAMMEIKVAQPGDPITL
jgi:hypothetical protein